MRWPILVGLGLLASPAPALADDPLYTCRKAPPDAKLTIQFSPDLTLHDLGTWLTGFTCKSVVYDAQAAARATKLALIAPSAVTPRQATQLFVDTVRKAGLAVGDRPDAFVVTLDPSVQRSCTAPPRTPRASLPAGACARPPGKLSISIRPDATLDDLAAWITGLTCKRVKFDPSIATQALKASLIVSARVTVKQASQLFVDAVEATGLHVTEGSDAFDVKPGRALAHCATSTRPALPPGPLPTAPPPPSPPPPAAADIDAALDAGIRKIDDTHYELKRALVDKLDQDPAAFLKGARVVPAMKNGKPEGFKLYAIRVSSLFARLGFENGDKVHAVDGDPIDSAEKALEAYTRLKTAGSIELAVTRRGQPVTISIKIVR